MGAYPAHPWQPWKFTHLPRGWWQTTIRALVHTTDNPSEAREVVRQYLEEISGIQGTNLANWQNSSLAQFLGPNTSFTVALRQHNLILPALLKLVYPSHNWESFDSQSSKPRSVGVQASLNQTVDHII